MKLKDSINCFRDLPLLFGITLKQWHERHKSKPIPVKVVVDMSRRELDYMMRSNRHAGYHGKNHGNPING